MHAAKDSYELWLKTQKSVFHKTDHEFFKIVLPYDSLS
jgi:hypothetical protein